MGWIGRGTVHWRWVLGRRVGAGSWRSRVSVRQTSRTSGFRDPRQLMLIEHRETQATKMNTAQHLTRYYYCCPALPLPPTSAPTRRVSQQRPVHHTISFQSPCRSHRRGRITPCPEPRAAIENPKQTIPPRRESLHHRALHNAAPASGRGAPCAAGAEGRALGGSSG